MAATADGNVERFRPKRYVSELLKHYITTNRLGGSPRWVTISERDHPNSIRFSSSLSRRIRRIKERTNGDVNDPIEDDELRLIYSPEGYGLRTVLDMMIQLGMELTDVSNLLVLSPEHYELLPHFQRMGFVFIDRPDSSWDARRYEAFVDTDGQVIPASRHFSSQGHWRRAIIGHAIATWGSVALLGAGPESGYTHLAMGWHQPIAHYGIVDLPDGAEHTDDVSILDKFVRIVSGTKSVSTRLTSQTKSLHIVDPPGHFDLLDSLILMSRGSVVSGISAEHASRLGKRVGSGGLTVISQANVRAPDSDFSTPPGPDLPSIGDATRGESPPSGPWLDYAYLLALSLASKHHLDIDVNESNDVPKWMSQLRFGGGGLRITILKNGSGSNFQRFASRVSGPTLILFDPKPGVSYKAKFLGVYRIAFSTKVGVLVTNDRYLSTQLGLYDRVSASLSEMAHSYTAWHPSRGTTGHHALYNWMRSNMVTTWGFSKELTDVLDSVGTDLISSPEVSVLTADNAIVMGRVVPGWDVLWQGKVPYSYRIKYPRYVMISGRRRARWASGSVVRDGRWVSWLYPDRQLKLYYPTPGRTSLSCVRYKRVAPDDVDSLAGSGVALALWSISNAANPPARDWFSRSSRLIATFPNKQMLESWPPGRDGISLRDGLLSGNGYEDSSHDCHSVPRPYLFASLSSYLQIVHPHIPKVTADYVIVAPPGSGKTTWATDHEHLDPDVFLPDTHRSQFNRAKRSGDFYAVNSNAAAAVKAVYDAGERVILVHSFSVLDLLRANHGLDLQPTAVVFVGRDELAARRGVDANHELMERTKDMALRRGIPVVPTISDALMLPPGRTSVQLVHGRNHHLQLWDVLVSPTLFPDWKFQVLGAGDAELTRFLSAEVRRLGHVSDWYLRGFRLIALARFIRVANKMNFPIRVPQYTLGSRTGALLLPDGREVGVSVSGHLINMIHLAYFGLVDIQKYMDQIEANYRGMKTTEPVFEAGSTTSLWHGATDWWVATDASILIASALGMDVDVVRTISAYCRKRLTSFVTLSPFSASDVL
jgi:hypothetical protein